MSTQVGFYREWRDLMRSWGFTVLEAAGWETRDAEPRTTYLPGTLYIEHHDASTKLSGNWGALAYILANRLANIVTARDGQIMLCAAGVAWHAGVGGPMFDVPANGANPRSMGNEVCNSGFETYDPRCDRAIIAGEKAWCIVSARQAERVAGHKEWAKPPGRKQDPSIDMNGRRSQVASFQLAAPVEDEMASYPFLVIRHSGSGLVVLAAPGIWFGLANGDYWKLAQAGRLCRPSGYDANVPANVFGWYQAVFTQSEINDKAALARLDSIAAILADEDAHDTKTAEQLQAILNAVTPLMAEYTYAPSPVLVEITGEFAIGATGTLKSADGTTVVQAYDLNDSPIAGVLVGPKGAHQAFKADIPFGVLDFGSVLLPTSSLEQQNAGLTALAVAGTAAEDASAALSLANTAASTVADTVSGKANRYLAIKDVSANYQVLASDGEDVVLRSTAAGDITITFPSEATEPIRVGASGMVLVDAAGKVTLQAGAGATLKTRDGYFKSAGDGAWISWVKTGTDAFHGAGELAAT